MIIDPKSLSDDLRRYHAQRRQVPNLGQQGPLGQANSLPKTDMRPQNPLQVDNQSTSSLFSQLGIIGDAYAFRPSNQPSDLLEQAENLMVKAGRINQRIGRRLSNPRVNRIPYSYDVPVDMPVAVPAQAPKGKQSGAGKLLPGNEQRIPKNTMVPGSLVPKEFQNKQTKKSGFNAFVQAIAGKESGGSYSARNPSSGAMGKYQIMPGNIEGPGGWDMEILGRNVTTQQFMSNPKIQDAIAIGKLKKYYNQYGPQGAASAWYSGSPNNWRSTKSQGAYPTVAAYVQDILRRMGRG